MLCGAIWHMIHDHDTNLDEDALQRSRWSCTMLPVALRGFVGIWHMIVALSSQDKPRNALRVPLNCLRSMCLNIAQ